MGETSRNLVLLANVVKNYRSASLLVCKQGIFVICSQGTEQALLRWGRMAREGVVITQGDKSSSSFVLRTYIVGGMAVKKLYID